MISLGKAARFSFESFRFPLDLMKRTLSLALLTISHLPTILRIGKSSVKDFLRLQKDYSEFY